MELNRTLSSRSIDRIQGNPLGRLFNRRDKSAIRMDSIIDIDNQLDRFRTNHLDLVKPNVLYSKSNIFDKNSQLYQHYKEESVSVISEDDQKSLDIITRESYDKIRKDTLIRTHLGLIIIGIKGLTRKNLGCKTLVCILDTRRTYRRSASYHRKHGNRYE